MMTLGSLSRGDPATVGHQGRLHQLPLRRRKDMSMMTLGSLSRGDPATVGYQGRLHQLPLRRRKSRRMRRNYGHCMTETCFSKRRSSALKEDLVHLG